MAEYQDTTNPENEYWSTVNLPPAQIGKRLIEILAELKQENERVFAIAAAGCSRLRAMDDDTGDPISEKLFLTIEDYLGDISLHQRIEAGIRRLAKAVESEVRHG
jgi:hypothetical protein